MKCLVFVFAIMAVALFTSPARADYALVIGWWPRPRSAMRACKACVGN